MDLVQCTILLTLSEYYSEDNLTLPPRKNVFQETSCKCHEIYEMQIYLSFFPHQR